jgi:DNA topoisomerase-1
MNQAVFDQTTVEIDAQSGGVDYHFRVTGSVLKFEGFLKVYEESKDNKDEEDEALKHKLPALTEGQKLTLKALDTEQHFTEPPPRFNEASLVKELEERGIGRPSTYSAIISTIQERQYVLKVGGKFSPTEIGLVVTDLLVENFKDIFDLQYTARLEEELDEIEDGKLPWRKSVKEFYGRFTQDLEVAKDEMESYKAGIPTGLKCEKCGEGEQLERISRHGFFMGCARYPDCDFIRDLSPELPPDDGEPKIEMCDNCGREMIIKRGKWGAFLACTGYPDCKTTRRLKAGTRKALQPDELLDEKCPECASQLVKKHGQYGEFIGCTAYPKCKYIRSKTLGIKCPKCDAGELVERVAKKGRRRVFYGCNKYPECDFTTPHQPIIEPCPKCGAAFIVEKRGKTGVVRACLKEGCDWEAVPPIPPSAMATPEPVGAVKD